MRLQDTATTSGGASTNQDTVSGPPADRRLLIDGRLVTTAKMFPSVNPATGAVIGHAPAAGVAETEAYGTNGNFNLSG